jgi:hypothetical protein
MNHNDIWDMWCSTFNGIRTRLDRFDNWYAANKGPNDPDITLVDEWDRFHQVLLQSIVKKYRASWDFLYNNRRYVNFPIILSIVILVDQTNIPALQYHSRT